MMHILWHEYGRGQENGVDVDKKMGYQCPYIKAYNSKKVSKSFNIFDNKITFRRISFIFFLVARSKNNHFGSRHIF